MIKLVHPQIERKIIFEENTFTGIVVENQKLFYRLMCDFVSQCGGSGGGFVLSENDAPIEMSKNAEIVSQFVPFEINRKTLLNKIYSAFEKTAVNEAYYIKTQELISEVERYVMDLSYEFSADFICDKIGAANIIKAAGLRLNEDYDSIIEKIIDYMEVVREFETERMYVFINMRSYFDDDEMSEFAKTAMNHKFKFMLLDSSERKILPHEKRITIDVDLCEI
ncbi:MAG: type II-A CRISPR-associated protein Csn2 [Clostridia bacterium]|nr:type II-A CRISPR-associated protein Csn2 [Clostridia bacterium]